MISCDCWRSVALPGGAVGWSAVCVVFPDLVDYVSDLSIYSTYVSKKPYS